MMKTFSLRPQDVTRSWYVLDASETSLGRLSTVIATLLLGKRKPEFTPHVDCGDFVVIINSDNVRTTGGKDIKKIYYRHTGYPGGIKSVTLQEKIDKDSTKVIELAVKRMLPANKLRDGRMKRLKIYAGAEHEHQPQLPKQISVKDIK